MVEWFEALPDQCPPGDAHNPDEEVYYRLILDTNNPITDMVSQRHEFPDKVFPIDECTCRSVSIFNDVDSCAKMLKFSRHQHKTVYQIKLKEEDGYVKKSFGPNHYSWWRSATFAIDNE